MRDLDSDLSGFSINEAYHKSGLSVADFMQWMIDEYDAFDIEWPNEKEFVT